MKIRRADSSDLSGLNGLENSAFKSDRISARSWRHLIASPSAVVAVAERRGITQGAVVVLYRAKSSVARIYSIAVSPASRGQGLAARLIEPSSMLAMRVPLVCTSRRASTTYGQTLDFTCGPCALMMAMAALDPDTPIDRAGEIRIWREATTVFLAAGHGSCGPFGLAAAAIRRGIGATVYAPPGRTLFIDSVRDQRKKAVIELVEADFRAEVAATSTDLVHAPVSAQRIVEHLASGGVPVVLIDGLYHQLLGHLLAKHEAGLGGATDVGSVIEQKNRPAQAKAPAPQLAAIVDARERAVEIGPS